MKDNTLLTFYLAGLMFFSMIMHLFFAMVFKVDERFFQTLFFLSTAGFIFAGFWNFISYLQDGEPDDFWKLGFLGFFGLLGLIPAFGLNYFAFFGLYGLFGLRHRAKRKR